MTKIILLVFLRLGVVWVNNHGKIE